MLQDLKEAVKTEILKGGNPFAIPQTLQLPQYQNLTQYNLMFPQNVQVRTSVYSLKGTLKVLMLGCVV